MRIQNRVHHEGGIEVKQKKEWVVVRAFYTVFLQRQSLQLVALEYADLNLSYKLVRLFLFFTCNSKLVLFLLHVASLLEHVFIPEHIVL